MKTKIKRKKIKLLAVFVFVIFIFLALLIYKNYSTPARNINLSVKTRESQVVLGLQKEATVTAQAQNIQITPAVTAYVKPAGFCINAPALLYHHIEPMAQAQTEGHASLTVDPNNFDSQMAYLKNHGYRAISADELVDAIISHRTVGKAAVVTIDDGYEDIYRYAFPIARKYGVILNLMIPTGLLNNPGYMSWGELKEMVNSGLVFAYDHTWSHYSLPNGDEAKIQMEIMTAKNQLEQNLGKQVKIMAYPYGSGDQKVINILQKDGFTAAFSTIPSFYQCDSYIFNLRRNRIGNAPLSAYGL